MSALILGLLAETFIHPGSGSSTGVVDLPVSREAATSYPVVFGSGVKGAVREAADPKHRSSGGDSSWVRRCFGAEEVSAEEKDGTGSLMFSDARLLLLPTRSMTGRYKWLTCPILLERYHRDLSRLGQTPGFEVPAEIEDGKVMTNSSGGNGQLFLEERLFEIEGDPSEDVIQALEILIPWESSKARIRNQLAIVSDDDFGWFAAYGLSVNARNKLDENKTSQNLWYEETLPPDTLMYATVAERLDNQLAPLASMIENDPYLRLGGNETVGQGWFGIEKINIGSIGEFNGNGREGS